MAALSLTFGNTNHYENKGDYVFISADQIKITVWVTQRQLQGCHYIPGGNPLDNDVYVVLAMAHASLSWISLFPNAIPARSTM